MPKGCLKTMLCFQAAFLYFGFVDMNNTNSKK